MRKYLSIFLAALLVLTFVPSTIFANNTIYQPSFSIEPDDMPNLMAGTSKTIKFILKNSSNNAWDVVMTPEFEDNSPFTSTNLTNRISIGRVNGNNKVPVDLNLSISPTAKEGTYPIKLNFEYKYVLPTGDSSVIETGKYDETIYVQVTNNKTQPKLIITKLVTNPTTILPGQATKLSILFENKGDIDVKNLSIKLEGLKNDGGFYISSGSDIQIMKNIKSKSISYVDFYIKASNNIKKGAHELKAIFSYGGVEDIQNIFLDVGGSSDQSSNLVMEKIVSPTGTIGANQDFTIKFDLRNNGGIDAKNILVKADSGDSSVVPKTTNIKRINSISPISSETLEFVFSPTSDAISKNYPISITVEYEDDLNLDGEKRPVLNQYIGAYIDGGGDPSKGKPKLIIDKYVFEPQLVKAGENFEMKLSFFNTNSSKTVKNIKIFLTAEAGGTNPDSPSAGGSVFTPVDSSNTFYIDSIPPKGRVEKSITMFTVPDALAKTHTILANFEYEDNEGNPLEDQERVGVPVVQQSKLETSELTIYPGAMIGQPMPVSLEFYNTGKVTLYNMMVKLEGDFQTENGSYYVGNFTSGSSEYFEGMVIPDMPGELIGAVLFTYEDSTGQMQEIRKEFTMDVMEMPPMEEFPEDFYPPMNDMNQGGIKGIVKSKWLWIGVVALGAIIGGVIFYKKKKREKEMALDE
ncbi:MAG: hypothetical protein M0Q14_05735 [Tissierellaceae bacterium]|nr:hypothetical protein [Tissierellaceae bacterium]